MGAGENGDAVFDTHAHVHDPDFDADRPEMLQRARDANVFRILTVGTDLVTSDAALRAAAAYGVGASIGIHPHEAKDAPTDLAAAFDDLCERHGRRPTAIGECGMDFYYNHSPAADQRRVLEAQLDYAYERELPLIFHQRDAFADFTAVLDERWTQKHRGVVHCFTGTADEATSLVTRYGLRLGIGGVLTFKTAQGLRDAVRAVGLDALILETDCPYLAPVPHRGKRNEPAFMAETAKRLAEELAMPLEDVIARTTATAERLFGP
jgi:TatD DNase family protein